MSVVATNPREPVVAPSAQDWTPSLIAAVSAVAGRTHDSCHGWDAAGHPSEFARSVLHDLDPQVPLPARSAPEWTVCPACGCTSCAWTDLPCACPVCGKPVPTGTAADR